MRVLVLGGYGLIGLEILNALRRTGHTVVGFGRSPDMGRRLAPDIPWNHGDMRRMLRPEDWTNHLSGVEAVVNAAGALQDGAKDDLRAVHDTAIRALLVECERQGVKRIVQISAPGANSEARSAFLATKGAGDAAVRASALEWTILKPGLVITSGAYGGTTLLRMLVAFPLVQPIVLQHARVQTVAGSDLANAVCAVLADQVLPRREYDLMEDEAHTLRDVLKKFRRWVGRSDALWLAPLPTWLGFALGRVADLAGLLGWRSPLRTTALRSIETGVIGDPSPWRDAGGFRLSTLDETLRSLPSTLQERTFGRAQLVLPVLTLTLIAFWLASGVIGLIRYESARAVIAPRVGAEAAQFLVAIGIALDLLIGWCLLWRRWVRRAAWASIAVAFGYLAVGTYLTPELWVDPLGPFVKVLPAIALALAVIALVEER
jgi:uncharacterized protein YbjT (DUF2867 family)